MLQYYTIVSQGITMPVVQFSLNAHQVEILESFAKQEESLNLTAKRVLTEFLLNIPNQGKTRALELDHGDIFSDSLVKLALKLDYLDDQALIDAIEASDEDEDDHYPDQDELTNRPETIAELEERIEKLEIDIENLWIQVKLLSSTKQPATSNNGEFIIFFADSEGNPIQFWTGQVWTDDLNLAYRYKGSQAMARTMDKLKKRKLPGDGLPGAAITSAPIEKLLENGKSWKRF